MPAFATSKVVMSPALISDASHRALYSSGAKARAVSQAKNPAPRRINVVGPYGLKATRAERATAKAAGFRAIPPEGAVIVGRGRIAHLFEGGTSSHFLSPGLKQGYKRATSRQRQAGVTSVYFRGPSSPSRTFTRAFGVGGSLGRADDRGEQSFVAIRFNRGDGRFYRGRGFYVGGMARKPFMEPGLRAWVTLYPQDLAKFVSTGSRGDVASLARSLGIGMR